MPAATERRTSAGSPLEKTPRTSSASSRSSSSVGGSEWMWRSLIRTTPAFRDVWKPTVWSWPTTNSVEPPPTSITTVACGLRSRPDIAPMNVSWASCSPSSTRASSPKSLANPVGELAPVGGVPHGRGEHRDVPLAFVTVDLRAVLGQRLKDAPLGLLREPSRGVHARTQAGHARVPAELPLHGRRRRVHVGDQQPGRVGADVHRGHTHAGDPSGATRVAGRRRPSGSVPRGPLGVAIFCYNLSTAAGWSSLVARRAHNPKVAGSNPAPAIRKSPAQAGLFRACA